MHNQLCLFFLIGNWLGKFYHHQALLFSKKKVNNPLDFIVALTSGIIYSVSCFIVTADKQIYLLLLLSLFTSTVFIDYYKMLVFKKTVYIYGVFIILLASIQGDLYSKIMFSLLILIYFTLFNKIYQKRKGYQAMGEGDIDILILISFILNLYNLIYSLLISSFLAILCGYLLHKKTLPFVPFLALGSGLIYLVS